MNDPEIPAAVNTGFASNVVVLVLNEDEAALNDPDIPAAVKGEANAPEISDAIWAELDTTLSPSFFKNPKVSIWAELDTTESPSFFKKPKVSIWAELDIILLSFFKNPEPLITPSASNLVFTLVSV